MLFGLVNISRRLLLLLLVANKGLVAEDNTLSDLCARHARPTRADNWPMLLFGFFFFLLFDCEQSLSERYRQRLKCFFGIGDVRKAVQFVFECIAKMSETRSVDEQRGHGEVALPIGEEFVVSRGDVREEQLSLALEFQLCRLGTGCIGGENLIRQDPNEEDRVVHFRYFDDVSTRLMLTQARR